MGWDNGLMGSQWCFRKNKANTVAHHRRACDAAGCPAAARRVLRPPRRWGRASSPPPHWAPPLVPIARGPILAATARAPPKIWIFTFKILMNFQKVWPGAYWLTQTSITHDAFRGQVWNTSNRIHVIRFLRFEVCQIRDCDQFLSYLYNKAPVYTSNL